MAKAKPKRQPSTHSRAARRAASPSLPIPLSKDTTTARSPSPTPGTLPIPRTTPSGIQKRTSKPLKRAQRLRQIRGMERAEENMDKLAEKVKGSIGREKKVRERRRGWEDVNEVGGKGKKGKKDRARENGFAGLEEEGETERRERGWGEDEDMGVGEVAGGDKVDAGEPEGVAVKGVDEDELL